MKPLETHGILGQSTHYPKTYAPDMLYPIPRALGRANLALPADALSIGMDWWQVFEMSWLNSHGISQVAMARLAISCHIRLHCRIKIAQTLF